MSFDKFLSWLQEYAILGFAFAEATSLFGLIFIIGSNTYYK